TTSRLRCDHASAMTWLRRSGFLNGHRAPARPKLKPGVATYPYHDESGATLFEVVRYDPKDFRQRRSDGNGGWTWNLNGTRRVPYRLPELLEAIASDHPVLIVEGEKDVDALRKLGFGGTTKPRSARKWGGGDNGPFGRAT